MVATGYAKYTRHHEGWAKQRGWVDISINKKNQIEIIKKQNNNSANAGPKPGWERRRVVFLCIIKNFIIFKYYNKLHFIFLLQNPFKLSLDMSFYLYINCLWKSIFFLPVNNTFEQCTFKLKILHHFNNTRCFGRFLQQ